ncbi:MAG TPA: hypothetical protein ACFE0H_16075 [Elainellaceae cyanobacterium]
MNYPIPENPQQIAALRQKPIDEEIVAAAIAGVIRVARSNGQSLEDLTAEVLADDRILNSEVRCWLSELVTHTWKNLPHDSQVTP